MGKINESKKLSIDYCAKILNSNGKEYTIEEVKKIRELLYIFGELDYMIYKEMIKQDEKGNSLRKSID